MGVRKWFIWVRMTGFAIHLKYTSIKVCFWNCKQKWLIFRVILCMFSCSPMGFFEPYRNHNVLIHADVFCKIYFTSWLKEKRKSVLKECKRLSILISPLITLYVANILCSLWKWLIWTRINCQTYAISKLKDKEDGILNKNVLSLKQILSSV